MHGGLQVVGLTVGSEDKGGRGHQVTHGCPTPSLQSEWRTAETTSHGHSRNLMITKYAYSQGTKENGWTCFRIRIDNVKSDRLPPPPPPTFFSFFFLFSFLCWLGRGGGGALHPLLWYVFVVRSIVLIILIAHLVTWYEHIWKPLPSYPHLCSCKNEGSYRQKPRTVKDLPLKPTDSHACFTYHLEFPTFSFLCVFVCNHMH